MKLEYWERLYDGLDVLGMVMLFYGGVDIYVHRHDGKYKGDAQSFIWAIYYMLFAILMTLCVFKIPQLKRFFAFLYGHIGKGIFIIFCGTLLLNKTWTIALGFGIYLLVLGFLQIGFGSWQRKKYGNPDAGKAEENGSAPSSEGAQKKYETGMTGSPETEADKKAGGKKGKKEKSSKSNKKDAPATNTVNLEEMHQPDLDPVYNL